MRYIETLREGERIQETYLCRQRTTAMTKTGKEYENVILIDKTGQIDSGQNRFLGRQDMGSALNGDR